MKFLLGTDSTVREDVIKQAFDHVRNYLICAMLVAVGITEIRGSDSMLLGLVSSRYSGCGVVCISLALMLTIGILLL